MRRLLCSLCCLPAFAYAAGAGLGDANALLCTSQLVVDVGGPQDISSGLPAEMGMPTIMRVDFQKKQVAGEKRVTPIKVMERDEKRITLQGTELGYGWTLVLNRDDGKLIGSMVDELGAIAIFGVCVPQ